MANTEPTLQENSDLPKRQHDTTYPSFPPLTYLDLDVPALEDHDRAIFTLPLHSKDFLFVGGDLRNGYTPKLRGLLDTETQRDALAYAVQWAYDTIMSELARLPGIHPKYLSKVPQILSGRTWAGIDVASPEGFVLQDLVARFNRLTAILMRCWMAHQSHQTLPRMKMAEYAEERNLNVVMVLLDEAMIRLSRTKPSRRPEDISLTQEFPDQAAAIIFVLQDLVEVLGQLGQESQDGTGGKILYYGALAKAYETDTFEDWSAVSALLRSDVSQSRSTTIPWLTKPLNEQVKGRVNTLKSNVIGGDIRHAIAAAAPTLAVPVSESAGDT